MKKNMKRIVTLVLCAVMALGLLAVSASADGLTTNDNVVTAKSVTDNRDGTYTVSLSAYATGAETIEIKKVAVPLDIVIALDVSDEMKNKIVVADREKSLDSIDSEYGKNASSTTDKDNPDLVYELDDTIYEDDGSLAWNSFGSYHWQAMRYAEDHWQYMGWAASAGRWRNINQAWTTAGKDIRVKKIDAEKMAAMKFINSILANANNPENDGVQYRVSVVKYGGTLNETIGNNTYDSGKNYSQIVIGPTTVSNDTIGTFRNAIYNTTTITAGGDANLANGMTKVSDALAMMSDSSAKKVVVVVSGGSLDGDSVAAAATAQSLKAGGAAIYTFCIDDAKDAIPAQSTLNSMATSGSCVVTTQSSQLDAQLSSLFAKVDKEFSQGGSNIELDDKTVLQDVVTEYFDIVSDSASAYSMSSSESGTWTRNSDSYPVSVSGRTVTATGFSYKDNWVGTTNGNHHAGKKLVVEFKIKPRDGFLGGNGVPTNVLADSGIYSGQTLIENLPDPGTKDVPLADLTVTAQDKNVYLTTIPTADQMKEGAEVKFGTTTLNLSAENYGLEAWQTAYISSISLTGAAVSTGFDGTADGTYTLTGTITSGTASKTFSASANILVFKPKLTYSDETIYLSQSPTLTPTSTVWMHGETASTAVTMLGAAPTLSDFSYSTGDFSTCQTGVTLTGLKVGGTTVTSGFTANAFAVHVLKPTLTASDVTIYRGSSVSLNGQVSISAWACSCTGSAQKTGTVGYGPAPSYSFNDGAAVATPAAYSPEDCKAVTASWTLGGQTFSSNQFRVHVLQPGFTVNTNDVWADYGVVVDLAANCVDYTTTPMTWKCSDNKTDTTAPNVKGTVPTLSSAEFTFGTDTGSYTVGEADQTFQLTAAKFTFSNGYAQTENYTDESFTVHVNTFDLTINKTWSGADCYKQDTIFIITRANGGSYSGGETLRVVIPKDKGSVTIAGLLCGQQYQVKEDTGWSWRWKPAAESFNVSGRGVHDAISKTKLADFTKKVTFTNTLNSNKTQWLSGSDCVNNVYNNNGWSQVTAGIVNKARQALHLG